MGGVFELLWVHWPPGVEGWVSLAIGKLQVLVLVVCDVLHVHAISYKGVSWPPLFKQPIPSDHSHLHQVLDLHAHFPATNASERAIFVSDTTSDTSLTEY